MPYSCLNVCFLYIRLHIWCIPPTQLNSLFLPILYIRRLYGDGKFDHKHPPSGISCMLKKPEFTPTKTQQQPSRNPNQSSLLLKY